jgi:hypothetical protein
VYNAVGYTGRASLPAILLRRDEHVVGKAAGDVIAAHCYGYSLPASLTMRIARSMTSGEYFGCFFMGSILSNIGASTKPGAIHFSRVHAAGHRSVEEYVDLMKYFLKVTLR